MGIVGRDHERIQIAGRARGRFRREFTLSILGTAVYLGLYTRLSWVVHSDQVSSHFHGSLWAALSLILVIAWCGAILNAYRFDLDRRSAVKGRNRKQSLLSPQQYNVWVVLTFPHWAYHRLRFTWRESAYRSLIARDTRTSQLLKLREDISTWNEAVTRGRVDELDPSMRQSLLAEARAISVSLLRQPIGGESARDALGDRIAFLRYRHSVREEEDRFAPLLLAAELEADSVGS